jgi:hypothetical protein
MMNASTFLPLPTILEASELLLSNILVLVGYTLPWRAGP